MKGYDEQLLGDDNLLRSIKEQKEHAQKGVEELLKHFSEEGSYFDNLRYLGSKYQNRMKEFQSLVNDNSNLRLQTRKLQEQLNLLRSSLQDSGWKQQDFANRVSVERERPQTTLNAVTFQSSRETMKPKLQEINKMKEQARAEQLVQNKSYDQLLSSVLTFLEMSYNTKNLFGEIRPLQGGQAIENQQMVKVPLKRYQLLIEMYAFNMADLAAKKLLKHLQDKQNKENQRAKIIQETQRQLQEKYRRMKEQNLSTQNLEIFFKKLSEKLGFEREWQKYHTHNQEEAVRTYKKIKEIIQEPSLKVQGEALNQNQKQKYSANKLRVKLDQLVKLLNFKSHQRRCWDSISSKIQTDELIGIENIQIIFKKKRQQMENIFTGYYAELINQCIQSSLLTFEKVLCKKNKNTERKILNLEELTKLIKKETLQNNLKDKLKATAIEDLMKESKSFLTGIQQKLQTILQKHLRFVSNREIIGFLKRSG